MKKLIIILLSALFMMSGCAIKDHINIQVVSDSQIEALATPFVQELAQHVKKNHPEDVDRYIYYCGVILACQDTKQIESYINIGIDTLIDRNINNVGVAIALKSIKGFFEIDIDTGQIDFDQGSLRIAMDLVETFKKGLE